MENPTSEELKEFINETYKTFRYFSKRHNYKTLIVNLTGDIDVYNNGVKLYSGNNPDVAIDVFNSIEL